MTNWIAEVPAAWRRAGLAIGVGAVILVALFFETAASAVHLWWSISTYNHAFLILPIALWLIWDKRHDWMRIVPQPGLARGYLGFARLPRSGLLGHVYGASSPDIS